MDKFLIFTIAGLSTAAIYAIAASGLVVTYTTSGIFNFAHGAFSMMAAFMFWQVHKGWGVPFWLSVVLVVFVIAPLFGAIVERVLMRGIEHTTEVVKIVVTISLMIGLIAVAQFIWSPSVARPAPAFFPGQTVQIFGIAVTYQRIMAMIIAVLIAGGLRLVFRTTRLGIAMRAVVDDRSLLELNGGRPGRTSALAWALGSGMAAISGVLIASEQSLSAIGLTLLFINAYAVAVVGRLRSLPGAFLGALILGLLGSYSIGYIPNDAMVGPISLQKLPQAVPGLMLFVVIVLQPQSRLRAHGMARRTVPAPVVSQRTAIIGGACLVLVVAALGSLMAPTDLNLVTTSFYLTVVTLSLVPLTGYAGQISLAQLTFTGIGAVAMATWGANGSLLGVLISVIVCAAVGALIAFPALRLSGIYLALATAAFAMICSAMLFSQQQVMRGGNRQVPRLSLGPLSVNSDYRQFVATGVAFALVGNLLIALRRSAWGRRLAAMRDSEVACATLGLNLTSAKVGVFALSAAIAGLAGAVSGGTFVAESLSLPGSLSITMLAVVGGIGSVVGAFIGGLLLGAAPVGISIFSANAVGVFSFIYVSVPSLISFAPALMGLSLGREPDGIAPQMAVGFRDVGKSPSSLVIAAVGSVVLWLAARVSVIGNWGLIAAGVVLAFALVPLLPTMFSESVESRRRIACAVWLAASIIVGAFVPWGDAIASTGILFLAIVAFVLLVSRVAVAIIGFDPVLSGARVERESPDMVGIHSPISRAEAIGVVTIFGITEEMLPPAKADLVMSGEVGR